MGQFRVELTVELSAESAEEAANMVAEMADGWSYVVTDFSTNTKLFVHLSQGKKVQSEPYPENLDRDPYEEYGTPEHEALLIAEERGERW